MSKPVQDPEFNQSALVDALQKYNRAVLMPAEFRSLVKDHVPVRTRQKEIESALMKAGVIRRVTLRSDGYRDIDRIAVVGLSPTPYDHALSIRSGSYLSHGSAVHLHGLTEQQPRMVYVNKEQGKKPASAGPLSQDAIDRAFSRPQRRSKYVFRIDDAQIVLLAGKQTGNAGVVTDPATGHPSTCLERTLIDIAVRPRYAGGVFQVMSAFSTAATAIDPARLLELLQVLDYKYPYHQALGFYLQRAGADPGLLQSIRSLGLEFDFYLDYTMASPQYDASWRVYFPLGV